MKRCVKDWHYPLGINGKKVNWKVAETEINIPGLIGIDFMRKWDMILFLAKDTFTSHDEENEGIIQRSKTSHPCIAIYQYPPSNEPQHFAMDDDSSYSDDIDDSSYDSSDDSSFEEVQDEEQTEIDQAALRVMLQVNNERRNSECERIK